MSGSGHRVHTVKLKEGLNLKNNTPPRLQAAIYSLKDQLIIKSAHNNFLDYVLQVCEPNCNADTGTYSSCTVL